MGDIMADAQAAAASADATLHEAYELLTVKEYAQRVRLHERTVYAAVRSDKLPAPYERVRVGQRAWRIRVPHGTL